MANYAGFCLLTKNIWSFGERVRNSFLYFHPDYPFHLCTPEDMPALLGEHYCWPKFRGGNEIGYNSARIAFALQIKQKFGYDALAMFDADTVICSYLNEFFDNTQYDAALTMNVARFAGDRYCNMGAGCYRHDDFLREWLRLLEEKYDSYGAEQYALNEVAGTIAPTMSSRFNIKIVDTPKSNVCYNERYRNLWKDIVVHEDKMSAQGRAIKVLHFAGGGRFEDRISAKPFSQPVREHLNKICDCQDFTSCEGGDAWWFWA
jgi:hypothetical protein